MPKLFAMMNKKQTNSMILAGIAISAILVTSSLITGSQLSQQAFAQAPPSPGPSPVPKTTLGAPPAAAVKPAEAPLGKNVVWQGTVSSTLSPLAGKGKEQVAVILPLRKDGAVYTGVISWTASKGVQAELWHQLTGVTPATPIPKQFGAIAVSTSPTGKGIIATALVPDKGSTSGSVPFSGNALALHGSAPFIATYSVTAQTSPAQTTNNVTSATSAATLGGAAGAQLGGGAATGGAAGGTTGGAAGGTTGGAAGGTSPSDTGTSPSDTGQ